MSRKTYKRELAAAGLLFWSLLTIYYFMGMDTAELVRAYEGPYGVITNAIWLFTTAAYGMDWWSKRKEIMGDVSR